MKHAGLGLRDYLPDDIRRRDTLLASLADVVTARGFQRIITPSLEQFSRIESALGHLAHQTIGFFDSSGTHLILRPDHTIPIARIVASRLRDKLPLALFYYDPVFRKDAVLGETEVMQFGCERIGPLSMDDEVAMIQLVVDITRAIGISDIEIHIAHPDVFSGYSPTVLTHIREGNFTILEDLPPIGIDHLPSSSYLHAFYDRLQASHLPNTVINLGLYKDPMYYNGLYFTVISRSYGHVLGSGGRYDSVMHAFDCNTQAFGFAFQLHHLEGAISACTPH
jgi:ATP phosphoribosyltransferase regulatory subunit